MGLSSSSLPERQAYEVSLPDISALGTELTHAWPGSPQSRFAAPNIVQAIAHKNGVLRRRAASKRMRREFVGRSVSKRPEASPRSIVTKSSSLVFEGCRLSFHCDCVASAARPLQCTAITLRFGSANCSRSDRALMLRLPRRGFVESPAAKDSGLFCPRRLSII